MVTPLIDRIARAATDEILTTIENGGTGLYWIDDHWNVSCRMCKWIPGTPKQGSYYEADLNYHRSETADPEQIAYRDTDTADEAALYTAIKKLVLENLFTIIELNTQNGTHEKSSIFIRLHNEQKRKNAEICVSCGEIIPEGRMICPTCEKRYEKR